MGIHEVVHVEKVTSELVGPVRYDHAEFRSLDGVLTFQIGLMMRVDYSREREGLRLDV